MKLFVQYDGVYLLFILVFWIQVLVNSKFEVRLVYIMNFCFDNNKENVFQIVWRTQYRSLIVSFSERRCLFRKVCFFSCYLVYFFDVSLFLEGDMIF